MNRLSTAFATFIVIAALSGCGGGSSSDPAPEDNDGSEILGGDGSETDGFRLGGTVRGLSDDSSVTLSNSITEQKVIVTSSNPQFEFSPLPANSIYQITITQQPEDRSCRISSGESDTLVRDQIDGIEITCTSAEPINVVYSKPTKLEFDDLRLLSAWEGKGAAGEEPIKEESVVIETISKSYISLRQLNGNLIYLGYIADTTLYHADDSDERFTLDENTTAAAMVLLEPAIAIGLLDHNVSPTTLIDFLNTLEDNELGELAVQIKKRVDRGADILSPDTDDELYSAFQLTLLAAAQYLSSLPFNDEPQIETDVESSEEAEPKEIDINELILAEVPAGQTPLVMLPNEDGDVIPEDDDVEEQLLTAVVYGGLVGGGQPGVNVTVKNLGNRAIAIEANTINDGSTTVLSFNDDTQKYSLRSPEEVATIPHLFEISDDFKMTVDIYGPGEIGPLEGELPDVFIKAVMRSVLEQYILRSLKTTLGIADVEGFRIESCYTSDALDSVINEMFTEVSTNEDILGALRNNEYYFAYTSIAKQARIKLKSVLTNTNDITDKVRPLEELLKCAEFDPGMLEPSLVYSFENTVSLWDGINSLIDTENGDASAVKTVDLFKQRNLNKMIRDLEIMRVHQTWVYENNVELNITPSVTEPKTNDTVEFTATCTHAITQLPVEDCQPVWDFGDGNSSVNTVASHAFTTGGTYTVTAKDSNDNTVTAEIAIEVAAPPVAPGSETLGDIGEAMLEMSSGNNVNLPLNFSKTLIIPDAGDGPMTELQGADTTEFSKFVSIKLPRPSQDKTYSLDDLGTQQCMGTVRPSATQAFCTKTSGGSFNGGPSFDDNPFSGEVTVKTLDAASGLKEVTYHFTAVDQGCIFYSDTCESITVDGSITFQE